MRQLHIAGTRCSSANRSFWGRHTVPKQAESLPRRHFIQRQKQITDCLQKHLWVAGYCNTSITSVHYWEVCWLARITVWAKSGGRADPCGEWWVQWPDLGSAMVTNVRMRTVGQMRQQTRLHGEREREKGNGVHFQWTLDKGGSWGIWISQCSNTVWYLAPVLEVSIQHSSGTAVLFKPYFISHVSWEVQCYLKIIHCESKCQ